MSQDLYDIGQMDQNLGAGYEQEYLREVIPDTIGERMTFSESK